MSAFKRLKLHGTRPSMAPPSSKTSPIIRFYDPDAQAKDARGRSLETILSWSNAELERCHDYVQVLFPLPEGSPFNFAAPVIDSEVMRAFRARSELRSQLGRSFDRMMGFYGFTVSDSLSSDGGKSSEQKEDKEVETATPEETKTGSGTQTQQTTIAENESGEDGTVSPVAVKSGDAKAGIAASSTTTESSDEKPSTTSKENTKKDTAPITCTWSRNPPASAYSVIRGPNWAQASRNWCVRFDHNHLRITRILRCLRVLGLQRECEAFFAALEDVFADPNVSISDRSMMYWRRAVERPLYLAPDDEEVDWLRRWEKQQKN
jgi:hypothetical protein